MPLRINVVVEGHGEYAAVRTLLQRVWYEVLGGDAIDVQRPFRQHQGTLLTERGLKTAVNAAKKNLDRPGQDNYAQLVLILVASEMKCPKSLAPQLLQWAKEARSDADIACVLPHPMFETWFVAAATSLAGFSGFPAGLVSPDDPEGNGHGKKWVKKFLLRKYDERLDQPRFVAKIDLLTCRNNSPSFDKLCRELEQRLPKATNPPPEAS